MLVGRSKLAAPLGALIAEGAEHGVFEVDDPVLSAHFVISLLANLLTEAVPHDGAAHAEPAEPEAVVAQSSRFVLRALGVNVEMAHTSLRIGFGRFTTEEEVDAAADRIIGEVSRLREMSPLWEMAQEGIDISKIEWAEH